MMYFRKLLKVRQFHNEFMKSSFFPTYEQKIVKISALTTQGRKHDNFLFIFWEKWWLHKFILKLPDLYALKYFNKNTSWFEIVIDLIKVVDIKEDPVDCAYHFENGMKFKVPLAALITTSCVTFIKRCQTFWQWIQVI